MTKKTNYKWELLALLWIAFLLNQADRQAFNVVLPLIKAELHLSDLEVGWIATLFNLVYALLVPVAGYIGDRYSRKWIIVFSLLLWSTATMFTGFANGFIMLIFVRSIATGGGEALFGPANYTLLASFHKESRGFAMSLHQTAYYFGIIVSGYTAGYIGANWGWRYTFYIFGLIGIIHGIVLIFRLKDKKESPDEIKEKVKFLDGAKILFHTPTALILTIAFCGLIFVLTGYLTWTPTYLYENFKMSLFEAGFNSMFYTHLFAFIGVIIAGKYSDKLAKKDPAKRLLIQSIALISASPFIILMGSSSTLILMYVGFAGFGFARAFFDANLYTVLYDVIPRKYQASASGIMLMMGFGVGSFSPVVLGYLKPIIGLSTGISMLSIVWVLCSILLFVAYKYYFAKDYKKAMNYEKIL